MCSLLLPADAVHVTIPHTRRGVREDIISKRSGSKDVITRAATRQGEVVLWPHASLLGPEGPACAGLESPQSLVGGLHAVLPTECMSEV